MTEDRGQRTEDRGQRTDDPSSPDGFAAAGRERMTEARECGIGNEIGWELLDFGFKRKAHGA